MNLSPDTIRAIEDITNRGLSGDTIATDEVRDIIADVRQYLDMYSRPHSEAKQTAAAKVTMLYRS